MSIQTDIENLRKFKIKDHLTFTYYLREIYNDLSSREKNTFYEINKLTFIKYLKIDFFIGEKLFLSLNKKKSETMGVRNFINGLYYLYAGNIEEIARIIFGLFDFGLKGYLKEEDVHLFLSNLPNEDIQFTEKDNEIRSKTISKLFQNCEYLNLKNFLQAIQKIDSTILLIVLRYFYTNCPFDSDNINKFNNLIHKKKISTSFSHKKSNRHYSENPETTDDSETSDTSDCDEQVSINIPRVNYFKEPKCFLNESLSDNEPIVKYENYIYKYTENGEFKQFWMVLNNRELLYYNDNKKENIKFIQNLNGCFIDKNGTVLIDTSKYYCFSIISLSKTRKFFTTTKESSANWVNHLKKSLNYKSILDHYEINQDIRKGKKGSIKTGINKKTKEKVAIKIILKKNYQIIESAYSEIDILKKCSNKYIVKYIDYFETSKLIFIVLEYISGYSLDEYISEKKIDEKIASNIVFQIGKGIKYLHELGIIHRNINPYNIIVNEENEKINVKIIDFSLSKMLGKEEHLNEIAGEFHFSAPEIIKRLLYKHNVDVWSLGVLLFFILSKKYPFDSDNHKLGYLEEIVRNNYEPYFERIIWENKSYEVIDLITLCLNDVNKRISIINFLKHSWFKKFNYMILAR